MRTLTLIFLIITTVGCSKFGDSRAVDCGQEKSLQVVHGDGFIGLHHPPMPANIEDLGGFVIETDSRTTELGIDYVRDNKGTIIWLDQLFYLNGCANPQNIVLDYRRIPKLDANEMLLDNCIIGDVSEGGDGLTIVIAMNTNSEILRNIRMAWRIDVEAKKLVDVSPVGIQCINEGFWEHD